MVLGIGRAMELLHLSMALGAFLTGLMLAESHYRHQIEADIEPVRGTLLGLFFMTVGMSIDFGLLIREWHWVLLAVAGLLFIKSSVLWVLSRLSGLITAMPYAQHCYYLKPVNLVLCYSAWH